MSKVKWNFAGFPDLDKLEVGTSFSHSVRQHLSGPRSKNLPISLFNITGDHPNDHGITLKNGVLEYDGVGVVGSGTFSFKAG
jgi:hypothetical protein